VSGPRSIEPAAAEPLVSIAIVDYAGLMRARSLTRKAFDTSGPVKSCGWLPANMSLTPFDEIAEPNPWGSAGDLRLLADTSARFRAWPARASSPLDIVMADIVELDGTAWTACPRGFLKAALADVKAETGCDVIATFEQEYQILDAGWHPAPAFSVSALRRADPFAPELMATLEQAGIEPEIFIAEYGRDQYEIASGPATGLVAADRAAVVRETARLNGWRASFAPKTAVEGVGNGVHVHFSFTGPDGPAAYDANSPGNLSPMAASFCAGILRHLPALTAFTAPSPLSAMRLEPHHWSASYTWLGAQDREAALRVCPVTTIGGRDAARQFNIEYRAADAPASPHLTLAVIVRAGLAGIRDRLSAPPVFSGDPAGLTDNERESLGLRRLPRSLPAALDCLERDKEVCSWFSNKALATYTGMKRMELKLVEGTEGDALCARYATIY